MELEEIKWKENVVKSIIYRSITLVLRILTDTLTDKERKDVKNNDLPDIIAFHSTEHQSFLDKIPIKAPSSFGSSYPIPPVDYRKIQEEYKLHGIRILKRTEEICCS